MSSDDEEPRPSPAKRAPRLCRLPAGVPEDGNDPSAEVMRPLSDMILLPAKGSESWMRKDCDSGERDFRWIGRSKNVDRK